MIEYIVPQIIKYKNIDDLLENNNGSNSFFNIKEKLCKYNACICQKKSVPLHHKLITYPS